MNQKKLRTFDEAQIEHYKKYSKELKAYIGVALEECQKDGNEKAFLSALSMATRVHGGVQQACKGNRT